MNSYSELLQVAKEASLSAGKKLLSLYDSDDLNVVDKGENDPVTKADFASHEILMNVLLETEISVVSEEGVGGKEFAESDFVWLVDPLDGTKDFIQRTDDFSVSVALLKNGVPVLGVVYAPALDLLFYAIHEEGAYAFSEDKDVKLSVVRKDSLDGARILVSRNHLQDFEVQLAEKYSLIKVLRGSAALKLCLVASGEADLYINSSDKTFAWDTAAGHVILNEAGGVITNMNDEDLVYFAPEYNNAHGYIASVFPSHAMIAD